MLLHVLHVPGADPTRDAAVLELQAEAQVCLHQDPDRRGVMWNFSTAMDCCLKNLDDPWQAVVQDDQFALPGWEEHLELACANSPRPVLGFSWIGTQRRVGVESGRPFIVGKYLLQGCAIAFHRTCFPSLSEFTEQALAVGYNHDDMVVNTWANYRRQIYPAITSRCIFANITTKSLLGHHTYEAGIYDITNSDGPDWTARPRNALLSIHANKSEEIKLLRMMAA